MDNRKKPKNKIREMRKGQRDRRRVRVTQCQESQKSNVSRSDGVFNSSRSTETSTG